MLSFLDEALVGGFCCVFPVVFVLCREEISEAHDRHHRLLGGFSRLLAFLSFCLCYFLSLALLLSLLLLGPLDLSICAGASLFFLKGNQLLARQGLGHDVVTLARVTPTVTMLVGA